MGFVADKSASKSTGGFVADSPSSPKDAPVTPTNDKGEMAKDLLLGPLSPGPAEAALSIGSGTLASALGGLAGGVYALAGDKPGGGAEIASKFQEGLTYQPRTPQGKRLLSGVSAPFEWLGEKADKAGGAVTDFTGSPLLGTATNVGIQSVPALIGKVLPKGAKMTMPAEPSADVVATRKAGYGLTPKEGEAGVLSQTAANLAGEPKLAKGISESNYKAATRNIAEDLGIRNEPLDFEALDKVRERHGNAYEALRRSGEVETDAQYRADLKAIIADPENAAAAYAHRADSPILKTVQSLLEKDRVDASSDVSEIKLLRNDAKKAFRAADAQLGNAYLDIAKAIEDKLDRHIALLTEYGPRGQVPPDAMAAFREAREQIAKSYDAQKALRGDYIDPQVYAALQRKRAPLTGAAKELGEAASRYERSFMSPRQAKAGGGSGGPTWSDIIAAGVTGGKELPMLFARPATRGVLGSGYYQSIPRAPLRRLLSQDATGDVLGYGALGGIANPVQPAIPAAPPEKEDLEDLHTGKSERDRRNSFVRG